MKQRRITCRFTPFLAIFLCTAVTAGAYNYYAFKPSETTSGIDPSFDKQHEAYYRTDVAQRGKLLVFLPGTGAEPRIYKFVPQTAADNGFHALGLMYVNSWSFIDATTQNCDTCYFDARMEVLRGVDLSPDETCDRANSIENRLVAAIRHLETLAPTENWGQFLSGTNILWNKILIAGHSQGAGLAGFIAKQYAVDRCMMFDSGDWYEPENRPATWISTPGATDPSRIFGCAHKLDPLFPEEHQIPVWTAFGLDDFGPPVFVEDVDGPPFNGSRMLRTDVVPRNNTGTNGIPYHGCTSRDLHVPITNGIPFFREAWEYMMFGKLQPEATFDGDTRHDLTLYYPPAGRWHFFQSVDGYEEVDYGFRGTIPVEADYDGDGLLDIAIFDPAEDWWYIYRTTDGHQTIQFGFADSIPVPDDFDGDGIDDLAVFVPATGEWHIYSEAGGYRTAQFGYNGVTPVPADYDGDGKADLGVYDASNGTWHLFKSRDGYETRQFGYPGTVPVHGDYDGDDVADIGVFDPSTGVWHLFKSFEGYQSTQFGYSGVIPVNKDFDGDGRSDIGVYDDRQGTWYLFQSRDGYREQDFGYRGTIPVNTP